MVVLRHGREVGLPAQNYIRTYPRSRLLLKARSALFMLENIMLLCIMFKYGVHQQIR
jgi:hypothetical protein